MLVVLATFSLVAAACGGSGGSEDAASDSVSTATDDSADSDGDSSESTEDSEDSGDAGGSGDGEASPLDAFLGVPSFDPSDQAASEAQFAEEERKRQEAIATCMRAEGFEYTPQDPSEFAFFGGDEDIEWGSEEWVRTFGYGVTTQSFSQSEVGPELIGYDDSQFRDDDGPVDPNFEYMQSLSEPEQEAYQLALYGQEPEFDPETMTDEEINAIFQDFEFGGCQNQASEEGDFGKQQAFYQEFGDQINEMYEAMEEDPRVLDAQAKIEACVVDKGVEYIPEEDAYEYFEEQLEPIRSNTYQQFETDPLAEEDAAAMSDEEIEEFYDNLPQPEVSDEDKAILGELQQEEIASAVAAFECGGGFSNQFELFNELRVEYEQRFMDENAAALEAFAAAN